jgi:hypothetical protein
MKFQNLVGQKFNKLEVKQYLGQVKSGQSRWLCLCDCGNTHEAIGSHLKTGNIKSCGCLNTGDARRVANTTHGMSYTPEWNSYHGAKKRCNPKFIEDWPDWAGRGIVFRFTSFEEFFAEVGPRPEPKHLYSLDRFPNNDGHYEKGNVRWATKKQQALNRRCDRCIALLARIKELENQLQISTNSEVDRTPRF